MKNRKKLLLVILLAIFSLIILIIYLLEPQTPYPIIFLGDEHNLPQPKFDRDKNFKSIIQKENQITLIGQYQPYFLDISTQTGNIKKPIGHLIVSDCTDIDCNTELFTIDYLGEISQKNTYLEMSAEILPDNAMQQLANNSEFGWVPDIIVRGWHPLSMDIQGKEECDKAIQKQSKKLYKIGILNMPYFPTSIVGLFIPNKEYIFNNYKINYSGEKLLREYIHKQELKGGILYQKVNCIYDLKKNLIIKLVTYSGFNIID